jgi:hypothetical protein
MPTEFHVPLRLLDRMNVVFVTAILRYPNSLRAAARGPAKLCGTGKCKSVMPRPALCSTSLPRRAPRHLHRLAPHNALWGLLPVILVRINQVHTPSSMPEGPIILCFRRAGAFSATLAPGDPRPHLHVFLSFLLFPPLDGDGVLRQTA